jgi:hypothetical protein
MKVYVTKHAIKQYRERINGANLEDRQISRLIASILKSCEYVSDDSRGILFRNRDLRIEMIVKNRRVITIYPLED